MDYRQLAYQTAQKYGIDPDLFVRQIQAESAFRPDAVSPAGAIGLGQLMPATARELGVDPRDPIQNIEGAARYMKQQLDAFKDPALALAAYNAGPSRVRKAGGIPNITETQNYVSKILGSGNTAMVTDQNMNAGMTAEQAAAQATAASAAMQEQSTSDKYKDIAGNLAVAFNSMRLNADPALASTIKDIRTSRTEKQAKNKTLAYLEEIGRKDLVNAIGAGLSPREAIAQMFSEAAELRGFNRQKELIDYEAGLKAPKTYEYQQLAKDLLSQGIAKTEQEALQMALSKSKAAGTTVNVGAGEDDFTKALMKEQAKRYETYQEGAGSARSVMENLDIMSSIVSQPDFYSGFGAETLNKAKRAAVAFGADPEGVKNAETFVKIAKDSALQAMGGSLGVGFSNADREFVEAMVPNIGNTVEGNKLIIETQKRIQNRKIELAMFAEQYAAKNGNLSGFTAAVKDWAAQNPLFTEDEKQQLFGGVAPAGAGGLSDEASSFLKKR